MLAAISQIKKVNSGILKFLYDGEEYASAAPRIISGGDESGFTFIAQNQEDLTDITTRHIGAGSGVDGDFEGYYPLNFLYIIPDTYPFTVKYDPNYVELVDDISVKYEASNLN